MKNNSLKNQLFKNFRYNKNKFRTFKTIAKNDLKILKTNIKENTNIIKKKKENKTIVTKNFYDKILKIKKVIKRNEFIKNKDDNDDKKIKKEKKYLKEIGNNLKNSIIQLKNKNISELLDENSIKPLNKYNNENSGTIIKNSNLSKKKSSNLDKLLNLNDSNISDYSGLKLIDDNSNKLELLNKEAYNKKIESEKGELKDVDINNLINLKFRKLMKKGILYDSYDEEELEDQTDKDLFYINPDSIFIFILDTLIAFITFYYLIYNPYYISSFTEYYSSENFNSTLNIIMELILILDFFLQFIRGYYDFDDNLIKNNKKIIINYLDSWFLYDIISIIPTFTLIKFYFQDDEIYSFCRYYCQSNNLIFFITFLKMIKLIKIISRNQNKFISLIESFIFNIDFFNDWGDVIFKIILSLIFLHVTTCIHIIIGRNSYPNWIIKNNISENDFYKIYVSSIYFLIATITSVGYGDISGYSLNEHIFQIFLLIIGIIAYSWLVSSISNYVRENNKGITYFLSKVKILKEIRISHPEMDDELYHKIYTYLKTLKLTHKNNDKNILLENLPYNLKYSILYAINKPLIEGLNFFKNFRNSSFILNAVSKLIPIIAYQNDIIIEQNEIINSMIFVKQGRLSVELAINMNEIHNKINKYIAGDFIIGDDDEDSEDKNEKIKPSNKKFELKTNNTISLMTTFNLTSPLDTTKSKPISFKKRILKFLSKKKMKENYFQNVSNKKIKYIKLYYIHKGEQYGEISMFLNKKSSFTLKVKSQKAELLFLKKIDAIEISSNYPNIWKRANKKSFKKIIHLKELVTRELIKFCEKNGIKYDRNLNKKVKHFNSVPTHPSNKKKIKFKNINNNINNNKRNDNMNNNRIKINKGINNDINKNEVFKRINFSNINNEEQEQEPEQENKTEKIEQIKDINKKTPYDDFEINNEIYDDEIFIDKINNSLKNILNNNKDINDNEIKDIPSINIVKNQEDNKKNKDLIKLIDSSRVKPNLKIHYHKNKKSLYKNNNYNVQYNINNSFNIQNLQKNIFNQNNFSIVPSESFNIKSIYNNLNHISKGKYHKDKELREKIENICKNSCIKNKKNSSKNLLNITANKKLMYKRKSFFERHIGKLPLIVNRDKKDNNVMKKKLSVANISHNKVQNTVITEHKDDKLKNLNDKNDFMLDQITKNIIDGDKNLNNPEIFYNELFENIIDNKNATPRKFKSAKKHLRKNNKKSLSMKKYLIENEENLNT